MSEQKKAVAGSVTILAVLAAIGAGWGYVEPALTWGIRNLGVILGREQVQAVLAAMALAVFAGAALPRWLPGEWPPARTRAITGLTSAALALAGALILVPTRIGFVYAVLAAVASPTVSAAVRQVWYWARPAAKPESLQP